MHRALIILQLSLWITCISALVLPAPESQIEARSQDDDPATRGFVTFRLTKQATTSNKFKIDNLPRPPRSLTITERENKYNVIKAQDTVIENSAGVNQDGKDYSYFAEVELGSDKKPLYMLLDTGASTAWVFGSNCASTACTTHNTFGPDDSKSYNDTGRDFAVMYGTGSVEGHFVEDDFTLAGLSVKLPFGVVNEASDQFTMFPFDGILGLVTSENTFLAAVRDAKLIEHNMFGISLSRSADGTNDGEIVFGGTNPEKYEGDFTYSAVDGSNWIIPLDDVKVGGKSAGIKNRIAYIDTGTSFAFGPPDDVKAMYQLIPDSSTKDGKTWNIPCDSDSTVAFAFSGKSWAISSKDFVSPPNKEGSCTGNIHGIEYVTGGWLLGDVFLKNVYTVFDADKMQIGFAAKAEPSKSSATASSSSSSASSTASSTSTSSPTSTTDPMGPGPLASDPDSSESDSSNPGSSGTRLPAGCSIALLVSILSTMALVI